MVVVDEVLSVVKIRMHTSRSCCFLEVIVTDTYSNMRVGVCTILNIRIQCMHSRSTELRSCCHVVSLAMEVLGLWLRYYTTVCIRI